ncbi:hypothetical protein [Blastococcus sp. CCUG 61487]|uniref:hypothetical protein n=1 Tax=Blastococcus sp. CCUG 61487 TaxID=1840703 RepID=UPI0010C11B46|nr:hypothetical protein [Blastococcus sp. CCUG 61487]
MPMKLSIDLDGLTWGQLFDFVDAARGADVNPAQMVGQVTDPNDPEARTVGLEATVADLTQRVAVFDHSTRLHYAQSLSHVLEEDGDARAELITLRDLRDGLLQ